VHGALSYPRQLTRADHPTGGFAASAPASPFPSSSPEGLRGFRPFDAFVIGLGAGRGARPGAPKEALDTRSPTLHSILEDR
jgi:hypothetical protein